MAAELVNSATCEKLTEMDWTKNIEICELVARDQRQARDVMKAIKKRLASKNSNTQLFAVLLLEMLMNNIGDHVHKQVIDTGILPVLVKIVKKKSDLPVREKIFLLLDATQTSLGGASGKFPQYYSAYHDLVSAGVQFPNRPQVNPSNHPLPDTKKNGTPAVVPAPSHEKRPAEPESRAVPESSIIKKAGSALEVLREVLDAVDTQNPEASKDEFTLDLVEQCSFQKQRVMHLAMTSRDDNVISQAIELNEQLQRVLSRHDELISGRSTSTSSHSFQGEAEEEEEAEQLFRRIRKGKACAKPEDEGGRTDQHHLGFLESLSPGEKLHRPIIRPLSVEPPPSHDSINSLFSPGEKQHRPVVRPLSVEPPPVHEPNSAAPLAFSLPPPPAKHVEREKFFQEKKPDAGGGLAGHVRGLSLHSRNGSSSYNGSIDDSD